MIAINILLLPEPAAAEEARSFNAQLRADLPDGFALDATHVPHLSLLHMIVRKSDLEPLGRALRGVVTQQTIAEIRLRTAGFDAGPWDGRTMLSLRMEPTPELTDLQGAVLRAALPFNHAERADAGMFDTSGAGARNAPINAQTLEYVRTFVTRRTGDGFAPHITVGLATDVAAERLRTAAPEPRSYGVEALAIYQLGNDGTARRELARIAGVGAH